MFDDLRRHRIPFYFLMCPTTFMSITGVNMGSIPIILSRIPIIFSQKPILLKKIFSAIFSHFSYEEKTDDRAQQQLLLAKQLL